METVWAVRIVPPAPNLMLYTPGQGQEERPFFVRATRDTTESITMGGQAVEHHVRISGQEHFYDAKPSTAAFLEGADSAQVKQRLNLIGRSGILHACRHCSWMQGTTLLQIAASKAKLQIVCEMSSRNHPLSKHAALVCHCRRSGWQSALTVTQILTHSSQCWK